MPAPESLTSTWTRVLRGVRVTGAARRRQRAQKPWDSGSKVIILLGALVVPAPGAMCAFSKWSEKAVLPESKSMCKWAMQGISGGSGSGLSSRFEEPSHQCAVARHILRKSPNIKWTKDRGKEPERDKADYRRPCLPRAPVAAITLHSNTAYPNPFATTRGDVAPLQD
jgi:hypothetical protein